MSQRQLDGPQRSLSPLTPRGIRFIISALPSHPDPCLLTSRTWQPLLLGTGQGCYRTPLTFNFCQS